MWAVNLLNGSRSGAKLNERPETQTQSCKTSIRDPAGVSLEENAVRIVNVGEIGVIVQRGVGGEKLAKRGYSNRPPHRPIGFSLL